MPKLPVVSAAEAVRALGRAGFVVDHQTGSHVVLLHSQTGRRAVVPRHGARDLKAGTLRTIVGDAGLTVEEFRKLLR